MRAPGVVFLMDFGVFCVVLEVSWGVLGGSQGGPGGVLGSLGELLFFWALLGPSWGRLGAVLGASWWPTWLQLGSQNGAKID